MKVESTKQEEIQNDTALLSPQMAQRSHQMPLREMPRCNQSVALRSTPFLRLLDNENQRRFFKHFSAYQCVHISSFCKDFFLIIR